MELIARKHSRIDLLDAVRGFAIICMVVYHGLYDITDVYGFSVPIFNFFTILEPWFAGAFILLSGISCRFSHSNFKRGLRVVILALIVTLGTVIFSIFVAPGQEIYFGILHFMGFSILLYALLQKPLNKIKPQFAFPVYLLLFIITYSMPYSYEIGIPGLFGLRLPLSVATASEGLVNGLQSLFHITLPAWIAPVVGLYPFGLPDVSFASADYFTLIPWFFLFLAGTVVGKPVRDHKLPDWFYTIRVPFFAAAGRNTLLIYVIHQPVIYLLLTLIFYVLPH